MPNTRGRSRGSHTKSSSKGSHTKSSTKKSIPTGRGGSNIVGRGREIANEWSPRGRGNNSSSGNGKDIPDECSPIGRGSNNTSGNGRGRADYCSPRGRGSNDTSRNDRVRADDISPRGGGSNNTSGNNRDISNDFSPIGRGSNSIGVRGNESVNEWCPSQDIMADEILDVHEDNEEHVVGSSENQVVSNITPSSNVTPSSSLPKLWLVGGVFYDPAISCHAVRLFKAMFKGAYATWTKVPQDHRDRCFERFGTFYQWEDAETNQISDAWESHMKNRYSDIMRSVRKAAMKVTKVNDNVNIGRISSNRPIWIGATDWQPMVNVWDTDEWRRKSNIAKENRAKLQSGQHTACSLSFLHTKIVMEKEKGRKVKLVELHTAVHTKKDKKATKPGEPGSSEILEFVDPTSKQRLDEYSKIISERHEENEENT